MVEINGYDIAVTRGDSLYLRINLEGCDLPDGAQAVLTIKQHIRSEEALIQTRMDASGEVLGIALSPQQTNLPPGSYVWDVRILVPHEEGVEVYTPMNYAAFVVLDAVGTDIGLE